MATIIPFLSKNDRALAAAREERFALLGLRFNGEVVLNGYDLLAESFAQPWQALADLLHLDIEMTSLGLEAFVAVSGVMGLWASCVQQRIQSLAVPRSDTPRQRYLTAIAQGLAPTESLPEELVQQLEAALAQGNTAPRLHLVRPPTKK